jgi:hypothetical protein
VATATITFRVDDAERDELANRAKRDSVTLSDYIRVRLGLRGQGAGGEAEVETQDEPGLRDRIADHERRLRTLEASVS